MLGYVDANSSEGAGDDSDRPTISSKPMQNLKNRIEFAKLLQMLNYFIKNDSKIVMLLKKISFQLFFVQLNLPEFGIARGADTVRGLPSALRKPEAPSGLHRSPSRCELILGGELLGSTRIKADGGLSDL